MSQTIDIVSLYPKDMNIYGDSGNVLTIQRRLALYGYEPVSYTHLDDRTWNDESRSLFLRLLASGPALLQVWEEIDFVDIPGRLIPEWLAIRNRPSLSLIHI